MQPKNYYYKLIKDNKTKLGSDIVLPNGDIDLHLILSQKDSTPKSKMTNNDLAKIVEVLVTTVGGLLTTVNNLMLEMGEGFINMKKYMDSRFDKVEQRLDVVEDKLEWNNII